MHELTVMRNDAGQRLDKFLTKAVKGMPQSMLYKCIRTKKIKVNRKRAEPNMRLDIGDTVQLFVPEEFFSSPSEDSGALLRIKPKLDIVFEDDNIILCNKRPGVLVHEDTEGNENTLIMHIKAYLAQKGCYDPHDEQSFAPALCNRIDRNTGGIVIAAKNAAALREMNERIRNGEVHKFYICEIHGEVKPQKGRLVSWMKKDSNENTVSVSDVKKQGYKECITDYRTLATDRKKDISLLEIALITGRTHQIRAQFAHIGHPLVGDGKYGINREDRARGYKYQALYSYRVRFDFVDGGGVLEELNGAEFSVPTERIWFCGDFGYGKDS